MRGGEPGNSRDWDLFAARCLTPNFQRVGGLLLGEAGAGALEIFDLP